MSSHPKRLTPKQERFVEEYLVDLNATQAAARAGYSHGKTQGPRLLENVGVAHAIATAKAARAARTEITADMVVRQLGRIAFGDLRQTFESSEDGGVRLRRPDEWPDEVVAMVAGLEVVTVNKGEGEVEFVAKTKLRDSLKALELLGRHLGVWSDATDVNVTIDLAERVRAGRRRVREQKRDEEG